ncbi:lipoprotein signal peptidase [Adhaeribacter aquaticus]|uniref:lipoprotein signal peptidase n=1 Tax=Adhaeribacter aquaticus TaxID=299567 RepID=UPI0004004C5B|nr:lipoprotein signal peptidase [Adhaeribacter aquaticus]
MKYLKYYLLSLLVIAIDQAVKVLVHFKMEMGLPGEVHLIGDWAKLHYTTNPGMAFGVELGSSYGKLILTSFRLVAMVGIGYYLYYLWKNKAHSGLIWCVALILGGAIGNLIDSIFYGVIFDNAPYGAPSAWFHGQVIDMFYLDIWEGIVPHWIPLLGGQAMSLWPIFNVADSAIFIGVVIILFNQQKFFGSLHPEENKHSVVERPATNAETTNAEVEA